jgi:hypothetical protein
LLILSGLSAITFVGAKQITSNKERQAAAALTPAKTTASRPRFPADLVNDDQGDPDFGDFQVVILTLVAALTYLATIYGWWRHVQLAAVSLPDVDSTISCRTRSWSRGVSRKEATRAAGRWQRRRNTDNWSAAYIDTTATSSSCADVNRRRRSRRA